jgi:release factor glutamine methyltransferase
VTTLAAAAASVADVLRGAGVASPEVDARWLVEAAAGSDPRRAPNHELTEDAERILAGFVARRCEREPLQLVLGATAFRGLELRCRSGVFVPRPETEVLAGHAIELARAARRPDEPAVIVLEPCCGTGAVGLAVANEVEGALVLLGDHSSAAVALARHNRDVLRAADQLRSPVEVHPGDLLDAFPASTRGRADVIVANPPYLPSADLPGLDPEVRDHDPHDALSGGPDGHELVDVLLAASMQWLRPGGVVVLEIDARRASEVLGVADRMGLVDAVVLEDLTGAGRFIRARRPGHRPARG